MVKTGKRTHILSALFLMIFCATAVYAVSSGITGVWKEYLLGQVGVSVRVEENRYNVLAEALQKKEEELEEREKGIVQIEQKLLEEPAKKDAGFLVLAGVTSFLGVLLIVNFYFDWKRKK